MESPFSPPDVKVTGLERVRRDRPLYAIEYYDGQEIPYSKDAFDVVLLIDVVHHEVDPHHLIDECARVARRVLIIKDHAKEGFLAQQRISLMDWASNAPYGIPCLYRYNTVEEWKLWHERHGLLIHHELDSMKLYPGMMDFFFGGRIQYLAVLRSDGVRST